MKKLLILSLLLLASQACIAQLSTSRRTLIEEFTSSSSDSSAASDLAVDEFEGEAPGKFCIVKWYTPFGSAGGTNPFYRDYPLSETRSLGYYNNSNAPEIVLNGGQMFSPYGYTPDSLRAKVSPEYNKTSPFILDITEVVAGDSVIADLTVRLLDSTLDLTKLSIGVIVTERYNQTIDINHYPYHTNIVRAVLPSLDPKTGEIRDALPFSYVMQGQMQHTFRFITKLGVDWDQTGLSCIGVIQNNTTKEVLQCNWTVPEIKFLRPPPSTYLVVGGQTALQFTLTNETDSDFTIYPQLSHNAPVEWNLQLNGMDYPNFILPAHSSAIGTFVTDQNIPIRGSADFILLLRTNPGIVAANISGSLIGNDSRDLIIKNWASTVLQQDPDIAAWKDFGLDAAVINEDAFNDIFGGSLLRFRTIYVERSNYGNLADLGNIRDFMAHGGRMIFNSNSALTNFSNSIIDTTANKYAPLFEKIFRTLPGSAGSSWSRGNVAIGNVFSDTLPAPFILGQRPVQPLTPLDTFSKPLIVEQGGHNVGMSIESALGKIAYLTFPISDIQDQNTAFLVMHQILLWFALPNSKVNAIASGEPSASIYPNPITSNATLQYDLSSADKVIFTVYDELGRTVTPPYRVMNEDQLNIDCTTLSSGTYYYSVQAGGKAARGKMVVSR